MTSFAIPWEKSEGKCVKSKRQSTEPSFPAADAEKFGEVDVKRGGKYCRKHKGVKGREREARARWQQAEKGPQRNSRVRQRNLRRDLNKKK